MANYGEAFDKQFAEMFNELVIIILLLCVRQPAKITLKNSIQRAALEDEVIKFCRKK